MKLYTKYRSAAVDRINSKYLSIFTTMGRFYSGCNNGSILPQSIILCVWQWVDLIPVDSIPVVTNGRSYSSQLYFSRSYSVFPLEEQILYTLPSKYFCLCSSRLICKTCYPFAISVGLNTSEEESFSKLFNASVNCNLDMVIINNDGL